MKRLRQLSKDSVVYGIGGVLSKGILFLMLPVYTRIFTPAEYGIIEMLTVICALVSTVLVMGTDSAQSFYFYQRKKEGRDEQAKLITAVLQWRLVWGSVVLLFATISSPLINVWLFDGELGLKYFAVAFAGTLFLQVMSQSIEVFRLLYRPWPYVLLTLAQTLLSVLLILPLVLVFDLGILGYFLGLMFASATMAVFGWYLIRDYLRPGQIYFNWWRQVVRFGLPLVPAGLTMYLMTSADRWFVSHYLGKEMLGMYAVGAKFALIMALIIDAFRKAWWPIAMDSMHSDDGPQTFRMIARLYMGVAVAATVILTAVSPLLVRWMTPAVYRESYEIVGVLAWQSVFYGFYLIAAAGIWKREKTHYTPIMMLVAAVLNISLNYLLIPVFGNMGAAIATALSFLAWIVLALVYSERLWRIAFQYNVLILQLASGAASVILLLISYMQGYMQWQANVFAFLVVTMLIATALDSSQWEYLRRKILHRRHGLELNE